MIQTPRVLLDMHMLICVLTKFFLLSLFISTEDSLTKNDKSLDEAIESGNWEEVAASAAKYVKNSGPTSSSSSMEV